jgi:hypothetical protein
MTKLGLIIRTALLLLGASIVAFAQGMRVDCSTLDIAAIAMIEEHGRVADISSDRLYGAALVMQQARKACRDERFEEARALYDIVLSLGPVAVKALDD